MNWLYHLVLPLVTITSLSAGELEIGVGQSNINPPLGIGLAGYYPEPAATRALSTS